MIKHFREEPRFMFLFLDNPPYGQEGKDITSRTHLVPYAGAQYFVTQVITRNMWTESRRYENIVSGRVLSRMRNECDVVPITDHVERLNLTALIEKTFDGDISFSN